MAEPYGSTPMTWRLAAIAAVIAAALIGAAALLRYLVLRDTSSPVSVEEALEQAGRTPREPGRVNGVRVPAPGVYVYDTRGGESFEAFISASHRYPATTAISVRRGGCGVLMRWTVLEERETEWDLCPRRDGWRLRDYYEAHEFFGQRDERRYECPGGVAFLLRGSWDYLCRFEETRDEFHGEVVGRETLRVGGSPVATIHVRDRDLLSGHEQGSGSSESWYRIEDGMLIRRIVETSDRSPVPGGGSGTYSESYELRLRSVRPVTPPGGQPGGR
jgi:hypothetical protein